MTYAWPPCPLPRRISSPTWASAILASAVLPAPAALTLVVLPSLAAAAWFSAAAPTRRRVADSP